MKYLRPLIYAVFLAVAFFIAFFLFPGTLLTPAHLVLTFLLLAVFAFLADVVVTVLVEKVSPLKAAEQIGEHLLADAHRDEATVVSDFRHLEAGVLTELDVLEEKGKLAIGTVAKTVEGYFGIAATPAPAATSSAAQPVADPAPAAATSSALATAAAALAAGAAAQPAQLTISGTSDQLAAVATALQSSGVAGVNIIHTAS